MVTVLTMTTIPSRVVHSETTVREICMQEDFDYLVANIPHVHEKTGDEYPPIPQWFFDDERIVVNRCKDIGSTTKIIPTLEWLKENGLSHGTLIMIDDDIRYPPFFVEYMKNHSKAGKVISMSGFCLDERAEWKHKKKHGDTCHLLENFAGGCWQIEDINPTECIKHWERLNTLGAIEYNAHIADDCWMSNYAHMKNLSLEIVGNVRWLERLVHHKSDALHAFGGNKRRYKKLMKFLAKNDFCFFTRWKWLE